MKYCMLWSAEEVAQNCNRLVTKEPYYNGCINWLRVFKGQSYKADRVDPNLFDVVHIQLTGDTLDIVKSVRDRIKGNTKLVINPDYVMNNWHNFGAHPEILIDCFKQADVVFAQAERSADFLSILLDKEVLCCPHPVDTAWLKQKALKKKDRSTTDVAVNVHVDGQYHIPYYLLRNKNLITYLVGYQKSPTGLRDVAYRYYSHVLPRMNNVDLIDKIYRHAFFAVDHYSYNLQGRTAMEMAALGIPTLGWDTVDVQRNCFPSLTSKLGDVKHQAELMDRLINDESFHIDAVTTAQREVEQYSFAVCKNRFMKMIGEVSNETE